MLKYVKVTPDYAVKRGKKWFEPSCFVRDNSERMLAEATCKFYGVVCTNKLHPPNGESWSL